MLEAEAEDNSSRPRPRPRPSPRIRTKFLPRGQLVLEDLTSLYIRGLTRGPSDTRDKQNWSSNV